VSAARAFPDRLADVRSRRRVRTALRRGLRWWLVFGPVRSGSTLMADLVGDSARWRVSDWGLHAVLDGPLGAVPPRFDRRRFRTMVLREVLAAAGTGHSGPLDLVLKQANLQSAQYDALVEVLGEPQRRIFCLRDPAGFMASAVRKFPDVPIEDLQAGNYLASVAEHGRIGGDVFVYHPAVSPAEYVDFLRPLPVHPARQSAIRHTGGAAPELATAAMWEAYQRLLPLAANRDRVRPAGG
jgi:hypothetical protein